MKKTLLTILLTMLAAISFTVFAQEEEQPKDKRFQWGFSVRHDLTISGTSTGFMATAGYRFNKNYIGINLGPSYLRKLVGVDAPGDEPVTKTSIPEHRVLVEAVGSPLIVTYRRYCPFNAKNRIAFIAGADLGVIDEFMGPIMAFTLGLDFKIVKNTRMYVNCGFGGTLCLSCGMTF